MDHDSLLEAISRHLDSRTDLMRQDIKELDNKLDSYQERLIKVESTLGFIKVGFSFILTSIVSAAGYYINKLLSKG